LKLVIVDLEILDVNSDGIPDLLLHPEPNYDFNERIHFTFTLRNNYPFATREGDVEYRIELAGTVLVKGDVGIILPGEEKEFNVTWKADQSTSRPYFAYVRLSGPVYESEDQAPTAKSENELSIGSGVVSRGWGLMVLFAGIMLFLIIGFIALYNITQRNMVAKEKAAQEKYDEVYGRKRPPALGRGGGKPLPGARRDGKALPKKDRPGLPSHKDDKGTKEISKDKGIGEEKENRNGKEKKDDEEEGPKKAPSLKDLEIKPEE
jgi:hypothetical protein